MKLHKSKGSYFLATVLAVLTACTIISPSVSLASSGSGRSGSGSGGRGGTQVDTI